MSEQKMPAPMESAWDLVARERRAAYDEGFAAGRQQEREAAARQQEREAAARQQEREAAARRVAEGAGEPVRWEYWHGDDGDASLADTTRVRSAAEELAACGYNVRPLYTTPPSADALVEALAERFESMHTNGDKWISTVAASALVRAHHRNAKHKENTDGR